MAGFCFRSGLEWNREGVADGPELARQQRGSRRDAPELARQQEVAGMLWLQLGMGHRSSRPHTKGSGRAGRGSRCTAPRGPATWRNLLPTVFIPHPFPQEVTDGVSSQSYAFMKDLASPWMPLSLYWFIYSIRKTQETRLLEINSRIAFFLAVLRWSALCLRLHRHMLVSVMEQQSCSWTFS